MSLPIFTKHQGDTLPFQLSIVDGNGDAVPESSVSAITVRIFKQNQFTALLTATYPSAGISFSNAAGGICDFTFTSLQTADLVGIYEMQIRVVDSASVAEIVKDSIFRLLAKK